MKEERVPDCEYPLDRSGSPGSFFSAVRNRIF